MINLSKNDNPNYFDLSKDDNQLEPPPAQVNLENGKSMWVIDGYRIWAKSYKEALELLPLIESF
jgi:hypothetical protein